VRARVHELAWSHAQALARLQEERCLVHGDFNNRNVLVHCVQGRWRVAAVIDWEFALAGSPFFDIATFLQYERSKALRASRISRLGINTAAASYRKIGGSWRAWSDWQNSANCWRKKKFRRTLWPRSWGLCRKQCLGHSAKLIC
jgi:aminoglycoside phosphotransferase (APT) family kinase protein